MKHLTHEEINAWLDGECASSEHENVVNHLAACAACAHEADELGAVKNMLGAMGEAEPPRSFVLPAEYGTLAPLASPIAPETVGTKGGNLRRFEPAARLLSIAAVLAFLVLGGGQLAGWIGDDSDSNSNGTIAMDGETERQQSALQDQEPPLERGELREQGDSAATGAGTLTTVTARVDTPVQVNNDLTPLEITTVGIGVVALAAIASWVLIHYRAGTTS